MNYLEPFRNIKTFIFDVDGVLTNSELIVLENGHLLRKMNTKDGIAIKKAIRRGYPVFVITGGSSSGVDLRLKSLGVTETISGVRDKVEAYDDIISAHHFNEATILFMGDDLPDIEVMRRVGLPTCPADAATEVKQLSRYISPKKGGEGCVRDVIEKVLKLNGKWLDESP